MHIGNKIKELIRKREISAIDFAAKLDLTKQAVYNIYERPHINTELLLKISEILEVPITYFFIDLTEEDAERDLLARNYKKLWEEAIKEIALLEKDNKLLQEKASNLSDKLSQREEVIKINNARIAELNNLLLAYEKITELLKGV